MHEAVIVHLASKDWPPIPQSALPLDTGSLPGNTGTLTRLQRMRQGIAHRRIPRWPSVGVQCRSGGKLHLHELLQCSSLNYVLKPFKLEQPTLETQRSNTSRRSTTRAPPQEGDQEDVSICAPRLLCCAMPRMQMSQRSQSCDIDLRFVHNHALSWCLHRDHPGDGMSEIGCHRVFGVAVTLRQVKPP